MHPPEQRRNVRVPKLAGPASIRAVRKETARWRNPCEAGALVLRLFMRIDHVAWHHPPNHLDHRPPRGVQRTRRRPLLWDRILRWWRPRASASDRPDIGSYRQDL